MNGYSIALFLHFLSLVVACAAAALTTFAALRLRGADTAADAMAWLTLTERVVRAFPVASLGLLGTGIYMTQARWTWSVPWIDAAVVGLTLIMVLGGGVEARRGRALRVELESSGMTPMARRLLRDPVSWSAKMTTLTLVAGVLFLMTVKPTAAGCVSVLLVSVVSGVLGAIPMWRTGTAGAEAAEPVRSASA